MAHDALEAWVDGCDQGVIHGWARWPRQPDKKPVLEVTINGIHRGSGLAALYREDLARHGRGDGLCGFAIPLDPSLLRDWDGTALHAEIRLRGGAILPGGRLVLEPSDLGDGPARGPTTPAIWPPPPWRLMGGGVAGYIDRFGPELVEGWAQNSRQPAAKVVVEFWEQDARLGAVTAKLWRKDLEETRQGDGRWSVKAEMPAALRDGQVHTLELRLADQPSIILCPPVSVQLPRPPANDAMAGLRSTATDEERPSLRHRPMRTDAPDGLLFSIIVNFYNMTREAERTLTSLTRPYQRGIGALRYEVLCIDNYSDPPLSAEWVASFGPEFRLIRPMRRLASPCAAINEAISQARGQFVAVMIDGAHILTPGVLREVWDCVTEAPDAVVALRQWFVGGDQRWLASVGYSRAQEDLLFDKINWPDDGYQLFSIGAPVWESPNHWFDGMIESNCLFMPAPLLQRIGGMDEAFDEPGAGYANLDLMRRASDASSEPLVTIIGEASFHQFHDGTTTNVDMTEKGIRVRQYENRYVALRATPYGGVEPVDIRVRGQIRTLQAVMSRQRPMSPSRIGITDRIRPGALPHHYDERAQDYLQSVYVECGLHQRACWAGHKLGMAPTDAMTIQEIIFSLRPARIITVNAAPGLIWLIDSALHASLLHASRIVSVNASDDQPGALPARAIHIGPAAQDIPSAVARTLNTDGPVMVLFAPDEGDWLPIEALRAYAKFVTCRSYLVFLGTALGQPWLGYSTRWYMTAIRLLVAGGHFVIDTYRNPHLVTTSPLGYLQRIQPDDPDLAS
jgi:cephalosporin hydroxylase